MIHEWCSEKSSTRPYLLPSQWKNRSAPRAITPSLDLLVSSNELISGDRVKATIPETITAPARVKANSLKRVPVIPPIRPMGA
ncbi:hypothetical protein FQZ97_855300 [compost metagenome]